MEAYVFMHIDNEKCFNDWKSANHPEFGPDKLFDLLRFRFNNETNSSLIWDEYVNSSKIHKVLMLQRPNNVLVGAILYHDDKLDGNNLIKMQLFCSLYSNYGHGYRLMLYFIHVMTFKKFYIEIFVEADIKAVKFF
jgi:hypothetical protein